MPEDAGKHVLEPLLNLSHSQAVISSNAFHNTSIYLGATAGMRLVR